MNKQQVIIIFLVGVMLFSVIATSLLLIVDNDDTGSQDDDAISQLDNQTTQGEELDVPDAYIPEGDVTELIIEDLSEGSGDEAAAGDVITIHYHGTLASDGTVFDSSFERGEPATFPLDNLIEGWREGIPGMKEGGRRRLIIPSELAYGEAGAPPNIGPNADLVFEIELIDVQ